MHSSSIYKTSDGKRKEKGKKKPVKLRNARKRKKALIKKLTQQ